jgi:hypothetical protein
VTLDSPFKLGAIQQISLVDGNAILKWLESLRRANKRGHGMTAVNRLPDNLQPNTPCGPKYSEFHRALAFRLW